MGYMSKIKQAIRCVLFPLHTLFSGKMGFSVLLPIKTGWLAYTRGKFFRAKAFAAESFDYFRHFVPKTGGIVFDVGGELGLETEQLSRMVGPGGTVYVFECFPAHVEHLKRIARCRGNVVVVAKACWNSQQELALFQGHTPGSHTAIAEVRGQVGQELADMKKSKFLVQADTLDSLWADLTGRAPIDFLKMDIEGAECEALAGAGELLKRTAKVVIAAYHVRDGRPTAERVKRILDSSGFQARVDENLHVYGVRRATAGE
jgi:FkbM family methyltransferase